MSDTKLVCLIVQEDRMDSVTAGSTQTECSECGTRVWISTEGLAHAQQEEFDIVCSNCADDHIDLGAVDHLGVVPGAIERAAEHMGIPVEQVEALWAAFKRKHGHDD